MRHLFVPACLCLMSWSGQTGSDSALSLDEFYRSMNDKKVVAALAETSGNAVADPVNVKILIDPATAKVALDVPNADAPPAVPERIPLPPIAKPVVQRSVQEVCDTLTEAAQKNDLPVPFFIRLLFQESGFNPAVVSSAGAQGIAQFMPETAADMGLKNPFDPLPAIQASARLLRNLVAQFGNLGLAAAAYNAGPKRVQDWLNKLADKKTDKKDDKKAENRPKLPEETQGYVKIITGRPVENWTAASATHPGQKLPRHAPCQEAAGLYAWAGPETIPLPPVSPLARRQVALASVRARSQLPHHDARTAAFIEIPTKSSSQIIAKPGRQQLSSRKRKLEPHKLEKVAQR